MANKLVGTVITIDSAMGNQFLLGADNENWMVNCIAFWSANTTGLMQLTGINTANIIVHLANPLHAGNTVTIPCFGTRLADLKVPVLTAGTGFIYLA